MNSRVHPSFKTRYRVTNWPEYERGLIQRGDVTVWLSSEASNAEGNDLFGFSVSVSVSGETAVVTALFEASNATGVNGNELNNSASASGAAYVFTRAVTTWSQAYLKASNSLASDTMGTSASISGDTIVVAGTGENSNATGVNGNELNNSASAAGAAYVFTRTGTTWGVGA